MISRLKNGKSLWASMLALVLIAALACTTEKVVEVPVAAPAGPTAAEIAALVQEAVAASPGISKADVEAAVAARVGEQATAADVKAAVDAAIAAQPAPTLDITAVERAVAAAVPKGTNQEEIAELVEAAVAAATKGVPTRGELEASIAKAVGEASAGALTAADIEKIVDASVGTAVEEIALVTLPKLATGERKGFSRVTLPELERPTNIRANLTLAPKQELNYLYPVGIKDEIPPPYREGGSDRALYWWVFMPPFHYASTEKNFALRQGFATGYSVSDDSLTYLLHINPDAVFQDGTPLTAQAVKDAWEFAAWPDNQVAWGAILLHTRFIEGIDAVESGDTLEASGLKAIDDVTLEIKMKQFQPTWPLQMAVWMMGMFKADQAKNDPEGFRTSPIGVGPYRASYDDATGNHTYAATQNWWGQPPFIKVIHRPSVTDTQTGYIRYENGEADILYADSTQQPAIWDPANPFHGDLVTMGGTGLVYSMFITDHPPFDDVNVRKAFAHAVDLWTIVPAIMGPRSKYGDGIVTPGNACYQGGTGYAYDPDLARQALAASKYGGPAGLPAITIEMANPQIIRMYEVMQEQWKDNLGVEINLVRLEPGQQQRDVVEIGLLSLGGQIPTPSNILHSVGHSTSATVKNFANFANSELDTLIDAAEQMRLLDPNYCGAWQEIERTIMENYYYLPLNAGDNAVWVAQPWLQGYVGSLNVNFNTLPWWQIGERDRSLYE